MSKVHIVGRAITAEEDEQLYLRLGRWNNKTFAGRRDYIQCKRFYDSFWPETYRELKKVVQATRPDFIFTDYQVDASGDVAQELCIPYAAMWPQMPWLLAPQPWIPGLPGTQARCLTSEHASLYDRLFEQTYFLRYAPHLIDLYRWTKKMRHANGVKTMPLMKRKPDHIFLVNSFFGLEPAKDVPPLLMAAGPILSDKWEQLNEKHEQFIQNKASVTYVAFGTHVILTFLTVKKIIQGLASAMQDGCIDGVVWSMGQNTTKHISHLDHQHPSPVVDTSLPDLVQNKHPSWLFLEHAPQRALLDHRSVKIFLTHAGPSSANESLYHGVPMLSMPIYGDQLPNSMRLREAGVALCIEKHAFTSAEIAAKVAAIRRDADGSFTRNVRRMQRIAHVASRRKHSAADLIEEYMYDWGLRFERAETDVKGHLGEIAGRRVKELGPMHLQTADMRMSRLRATNMDEVFIFIGFFGVMVGAWKLWDIVLAW